MKIEVKSYDCKLTKALREYIASKVYFTFGRLCKDIDVVSVAILDVRRRKGSLEKTCLIKVAAKSIRTIVVKEKQKDIYHAIDIATQRARHTLVRQRGKSKKLLRRASMPDSWGRVDLK